MQWRKAFSYLSAAGIIIDAFKSQQSSWFYQSLHAHVQGVTFLQQD